MPNRIIKESICRSETIDSLSWFEEVLFYRLIVVCDDYGRFDGRAAVIKGSCFPLKDDITKKHISEAIDKLSTVGLVMGYEVQGRSYLQLTTWDCHQQKRAKKSKYPSPEDGSYKDISSDITCDQMISDAPEKRETRNENRESYSRNENARASAIVGEVRLFEEFWAAYPLKKNRHLAERAYISTILDGVCTENDLLSAAKNYAEYCKITETKKIYHANNFLEKCVFDDYLPGKYKKPETQKKSGFNDFSQRKYNFEKLEKQLLGGV